jgi:hypothetical protein
MMRRACLAVLLSATLQASAGAQQRSASWGEHGMALFGGSEALYASHLPMFHAPHDYQVVLQVHLADAAQDAALRRRLDGKNALWTIAPEQFALDRLAPAAPNPLRRFQADMVLGHFEQGGTTQYAGATVVIDKVLLFRRLAPQLANKDSARYLQLGRGARRYLVKEIDSRPDFDHIVAATTAPRAPKGPIVVAKKGMREPSAGQLETAMGKPARITGTVYYFAGDLE